MKYMHLGAVQVGVRQILQRCWSSHVVAATTSIFLVRYVVLIRQLLQYHQQPVNHALQQAISNLGGQAALYVHHVMQWQFMDSALYDIPLLEWLQAREFRPRLHLRIGNIPNDMHAMKMTQFNTHQLSWMFDLFGIRQYCHAHDEVDILVGTGHFRHGRECRYRFNPEELFLFTLTKCATGMSHEKIVDNYFGGHYSRWSYGYRWMLFYLDNRYRDIIRHQGLLRFLPDFARFRNAIEDYVRKDRWYHDNDGSSRWVPGIDRLPFNIFGFIDDSIDKIRVPFSGPAGHFEGAPRRAEYINAQESVYSGWKKLHGIKVETIYLPNGISTIFGPTSCRHNDRGTLNMSQLDRFLGLIQAHLPQHLRCFAFGDGIFRGTLENITSYYRAILPNVLTAAQQKCNSALRCARVPIEKNYGQTSCVFRVCDSSAGIQLGKRHQYAIEQLRVCHLLMNCYVCLNGDQGGSVNTFGISPPRLDRYLHL